MVSSNPVASVAPVPISATTHHSYNNNNSQPDQLNMHHIPASPQSNLSEADADGEPSDEVFSNPDTAELGYRSDGTGATSPGPNSPGPSSPLSRSMLYSAVAAKVSQSAASKLTPASPPTLRLAPLATLPKAYNANHTVRSGADADTSAPIDWIRNDAFANSALSSPNSPTSAGIHLRKDHSFSPSRVVSASHSPHAASSAPYPGSLPSANELPSDPVEACTVSRLFAHPPAASGPSSTLASPPRTPGSGARSGGVILPLGSPSLDKTASTFKLFLSGTRTSSPDPTSRTDRSTALACPNTTPVKLGAGSISSRPVSGSLGNSHGVGLGHPPTPNQMAETRSPSIFERDIEHRDASHIMTKQEAIDVAIPSVLDDAVEAIIEDNPDQIEIVSPQNLAPPLAPSSAAFSAHSGTSSPVMATSSSPPLSSSGQMEAPPGSMAAQIAEKLGSRHVSTLEDARQAASGGSRWLGGHGRPNSDAESLCSLRSRSPQAKGASWQEMLDPSPVGSRASVSPAPGPVSSLAATVSQASVAPSPHFAHPTSLLGTPTATAFLSLPVPNPYRSSSPNLSALALPTEAARPAVSSLSIDGAVISGSEVASIDQSLDSLADAIACSEVEEMASPYVARSPTHLMIPASGSCSPIMDRQKARQSKSSTGHARPGSLGIGGLGVFQPGEAGFHLFASGSPSPSQEKRRLSFFAYADILNENRGEVMDFEGAVRQAVERDEQQHGHVPAAHVEHLQQASILQQLGQSPNGMSRSMSTSAAVSPRIVSGSRVTSVSGANTPLRGRREVLENRALANRLESLQLGATEGNHLK